MSVELWKKMQELNCRLDNICNNLTSLRERGNDCILSSNAAVQNAINLLDGLLEQDNMTIAAPAAYEFLPGYNGEMYRTTSQVVGSNLVIIPFQIRALVDTPPVIFATYPPAFSPPVGAAIYIGDIIRPSTGFVVSSLAITFFGGSASFSSTAAILAGDIVSGTITYQV